MIMSEPAPLPELQLLLLLTGDSDDVFANSMLIKSCSMLIKSWKPFISRIPFMELKRNDAGDQLLTPDLLEETEREGSLSSYFLPVVITCINSA